MARGSPSSQITIRGYRCLLASQNMTLVFLFLHILVVLCIFSEEREMRSPQAILQDPGGFHASLDVPFL